MTNTCHGMLICGILVMIGLLVLHVRCLNLEAEFVCISYLFKKKNNKEVVARTDKIESPHISLGEAIEGKLSSLQMN